MDLLGNESKLPSAGKACVAAAGYVANEDGDYPAGLRAGLDVAAPTIAFSTASPRANASSLKEFQVQVADVGGSTGKSGLHSDEVLAKIEVRDADGDIICGDDDDVGGAAGEEKLTGECALAGGLGFNDPLATTSGLSPAADNEDGYYTFTAVAQDKAGNKSEPIMRTAVNDGDAPNVGVIVGGYDKGAYSLTVTLTDNLSIKEYWAEARFAANDASATLGGLTITNGGLLLPREGSMGVDTYNGPELTQSHLESGFKVLTFRAVQDGTTVTELASIGIVATDHGGNNSGSEGIATFNPPLNLDDMALLVRTATTFTFANQEADDAPAYDEVFQTFSASDTSVEDNVIELRAEIAGTRGYSAAVEAVVDDPDTTEDETAAEVPGQEGLVDNPVSRVDFYAAVQLRDVSSTNTADRVPPVPYGNGLEALVYIGSASAAGAEDFLDAGNADAPSRKYVWGIDVSRAAFLDAVGGENDYGATGTPGNIVAFAVTSDGVALQATAVNVIVEN